MSESINAYTVWAVIGAIWLIVAVLVRYTIVKKTVTYEDASEQWVLSALWPLMAVLITGLWVAFRGWPLLLLAVLVGGLFVSTTGLLQ